MRRLLGVLRDSDGERAHAPAPGLADARRASSTTSAPPGCPVTLDVEGERDGVNAGVELSAYRVVQEALTNVIKHAGTPTRVDVTRPHRRARSRSRSSTTDAARRRRADNGGCGTDGSGHGLVGMRERVELWGGELLGRARARRRLPGDGAAAVR